MNAEQTMLQPIRLEGLVAQMIDEVDYPMLLATPSQLLHANRAALQEMRPGGALALLDAERYAHASALGNLRHAVSLALAAGLRQWVSVALGDDAADVSVVPLSDRGHGLPQAAVLTFPRAELCPEISLTRFARAHGLTPAETAVLRALCTGLVPDEIARRHGVKLSTVRTQLSVIRAKTQAPHLRAMVERMARLPPIVPAVAC